jgi:hypothetical protein
MAKANPVSDGEDRSWLGHQGLAKAAKISHVTVARFERGERLKDRTLAAMR